MVARRAGRSTSSPTPGLRSQLFAVPAAGGTPKALTTGDHTRPRLALFRGAGRARVRPRRAGERRRSPRPRRRPARRPASRTSSTIWRRRSACRGSRPSPGPAADGATIEGLLYYPLDYVAGTRVPLVVQTHGGPASSDRFGFGVVEQLHRRPRRARLRRAEAELPRQHRLRRRRSCATWSATTSRTRTSTSSPASTRSSPAASPIPIAWSRWDGAPAGT